MAMYLKGMHSLQVKLDCGKNEQGRSVVVNKTFDNINKSIVATNDAQTTPLYDFAVLVAGITECERLQGVVLHQHGDLEQ